LRLRYSRYIGIVLEDSAITGLDIEGFSQCPAKFKPYTPPATLANREPRPLRKRYLVHQPVGFMGNPVDPIFWNRFSGMVFLGHSLTGELEPQMAYGSGFYSRLQEPRYWSTKICALFSRMTK
jgi:hypothetical protein